LRRLLGSEREKRQKKKARGKHERIIPSWVLRRPAIRGQRLASVEAQAPVYDGGMRRHNYYLKLTLKNEIVEDPSEMPLFGSRQKQDFYWLRKTLELAGRKPQIRALVLLIKNVSIGWAQIEELHRDLDRFHAAGKKSIAYLEHADNRSYYLASGLQRIFVPPPAPLELVGLRAEILYFKNLLDSFGIEPELFSIGQYKSAAEILMREEMSDASRRMTESILEDVQSRLKERVADQRRVSPERVQAWIDKGPYTARRALKEGLIDGIHYEDEIEDVLKAEIPALAELPSAKIHPREGLIKRILTYYRPQIAYLVAEGVLMPGESRRGRGHKPVLGADTLTLFLRDARRRKRIKAVVLRINSPGGSALASDLLWREIKLTGQKKPVIVSFGDVAGSGGYYIATAAKSIFTMPSTLTGSIGVIGGKVNVQRLLARLGITVDSLDKGEHAGYSSMTRPFSEEESEVVFGQMKEFYEELFLKKVAEGRRRSPDEIRGLAEGRVWTGSQALGNGLADSSGGICEAIEQARKEADLIGKFRVIRYARRRSLRDLVGLPLLGTLASTRIWALMPLELKIR
jgi:protease IV